MGAMRGPGLVMVFVAACGGVRGAAPAAPGKVELVDAAAATKYSRYHQHVEVPFDLDRAGISGTALALGFLQGAQARGASYVSDLSIAIDFEHAGVPVECVTTIIVGAPAHPAGEDAAPAPVAPADDIYSTTVRPWQPDVVTATVDDREPVCKKHGHQVIGMVPDYESRFDVTVARYIAPGEMPMHQEAQIVWTEDCTLASVHHTVRRYAHLVAARVTPVDLARIGREFASSPLTESPPVCHKLAAGEQPHQRITGDVHYLGGIGPASQLPDIVAH